MWKNAMHMGLGFEPDMRITYALGNLIQTTSAVVDVVSGELLETTTFYPNGARETLRTNSQSGSRMWGLEPTGFTGKEGDDEVGLTYFGERYLLAHLGRWASPDPLQVHAGGGGEFGNSYHYVSGNLLTARDPLGLDIKSSDVTYTNASDSSESVTVDGEYDAAMQLQVIQDTVDESEVQFFYREGNDVRVTNEAVAAYALDSVDRLFDGEGNLSAEARDYIEMELSTEVFDTHFIDPRLLPGWVGDAVYSADASEGSLVARLEGSNHDLPMSLGGRVGPNGLVENSPTGRSFFSEEHSTRIANSVANLPNGRSFERYHAMMTTGQSNVNVSFVLNEGRDSQITRMDSAHETRGHLLEAMRGAEFPIHMSGERPEANLYFESVLVLIENGTR